MFDLVGMQVDKTRRELKTTVLQATRGIWSNAEIDKLASRLRTEVSGHPDYPERLILLGHYTGEEIAKVGVGSCYIRCEEGLDSLPFRPGFI